MSTNWEVAAKAIQNPGFKISRRDWPQFCYIFFKDEKWIAENNEDYGEPSFHQDTYGGFIEYKEPPKLIKWYRAVYWFSGGIRPQLSKILYKSEEDFFESNSTIRYKILKLIQEIEAPETWKQCK